MIPRYGWLKDIYYGKRDRRDVCLFCKFHHLGLNNCSKDKQVKDPRTQTCEDWRHCA